jgi:opacity protein-like surface antigen
MDRTRHPNITPTIFVALSALTGMSAAHAATITQTFDTGQLTTNVVNDPITFADFNTSLGTLTSVVVTLGGSVERDLIFKNTSPNSERRPGDILGCGDFL